MSRDKNLFFQKDVEFYVLVTIYCSLCCFDVCIATFGLRQLLVLSYCNIADIAFIIAGAAKCCTATAGEWGCL